MLTGSTIHALYVDDDKDEYYLLKDLVDEFYFIDFEITWVKSYDEAIEAAKELKHQFYLIDYRLSGRSGLDLVKELTKIDTRISSCYMLLTGINNPEIEDEALSSGIDNFISKADLNAQLLERTVRYTLEAKKNYIELEKSRNQYKQIYLNTNTPVIEVGLDYKVLKVNTAFNKTFKYPTDYVIHPKETNLLIWELLDCNDIKDRVIEHIQNKRSKTAEIFECNNQQKEVLLVQMNVYELVDSDENHTFQIVLNDLTEKVKRDRQIEERKRIDLMEKMARIVAHEVRNPLSNIVLSNEQLSTYTSDSGSLYVDIIKRNSIRIEALIKRFLNTFKQAEVEKKLGCVSELVLKCVENFEDKARLTNVKIEVDIEKDLPLIWLDEDKVFLVLNNLVSNAIQASETFDDATIKMIVRKSEDEVEIIVCDNGVGISDEDMNSLFEPFFTKKTEGLGLGLTTSLNIIRSHDGNLVASQNEGRGASFILSLPIITT